MEFYDLSGLWQAETPDGREYPMYLPGTLDENGIGEAQEASATRFTRKFAFSGEVKIGKNLLFSVPRGKRLFVESERARCLRLLINGKEAKHFRPATLVSPQVFEVTGMLTGKDRFEFLSDNTYPGLPAKDILYSSMATDETQTNWNGLLGFLRLRLEEGVFIEEVRVYPVTKGVYSDSDNNKNNSFKTGGRETGIPTALVLHLDISANVAWRGTLFIHSDALREKTKVEAEILPGRNEIITEPLALSEEIRLWDEGEGECYELTVSGKDLAPKTVSFGVRSFSYDKEGRLTLNGRRIFLRGEANCAEFPESGHEPMTVEEWMGVLRRYQSYGVNCTRFHSHCPPEAAFVAADRLGMLMQPELSCWNPENAFLSPESFAYYCTELEELLRVFANHPSFVMLSFGNELQSDEVGHERMRQMIARAHKLDGTRLIADGSNNHYGGMGCEEDSDFYAAQSFRRNDLRGISANMTGYINHTYPSAKENFGNSMKKLRTEYKKPVFGFEVGQFEVLPDFSELDYFCGVTDPKNLQKIKERVSERGIKEEQWGRQVAASGELALICYREEIEAALRTKEMSGLSLLSLQDFPGQGTALVGMMNSHLLPKPYPFADPKRFSEFFRAQLPLVLLSRYTYETSDCLCADVVMANYGGEAIRGNLYAKLSGEFLCLEYRETKEVFCPCGELTKVGELSFMLNEISSAARLELFVEIGGVSTHYPIWVYPQEIPYCPDTVYQTKVFDEATKKVLKEGGSVYLTPDSTKENLPNSIKAQFSTDFWSVGTFSSQEGGMGLLLDEKHPLFRDFPTEFHTNWQWWAMAGQRAVILPERIETIVAELDSYAYLRPMAMLFECRCLNGKLLFSSMGLQNLQKYPECRALLCCIYHYLASKEFAPTQEISPEFIGELLHCDTSPVLCPHVS